MYSPDARMILPPDLTGTRWAIYPCSRDWGNGQCAASFTPPPAIDSRTTALTGTALNAPDRVGSTIAARERLPWQVRTASFGDVGHIKRCPSADQSCRTNAQLHFCAQIAQLDAPLGRVDKRESRGGLIVIKAGICDGDQFGPNLISDYGSAFFDRFTLAVRAQKRRKPPNHRVVLDGIFWIALTNLPWRVLLEEFGKWSIVYRQIRPRMLVGLGEGMLP